MKAVAFFLVAVVAIAACTSGPVASTAIEPRTVAVPSIAGGSVMQLTIDDRSGRLTDARAATVEEVEQAAGLVGDIHIAATDVAGQPGSVLIRWGAFGCDTSGRLTISPEADAITVAPGPIGNCDALGDMRGVVLGFDPPLAPAALRLDLLPTAIIEAAASESPTPGAPSPTASLAPTPTPEPLADALARNNMFLIPAEAGSAPVIGEDQALAIARESFTLGTPTISLGRLTVEGWHVGGDTSTPLAVEDRLVYVVQLTGLTEYAMGGSDVVHHELVVFIDALTGDFLIGTTVR